MESDYSESEWTAMAGSSYYTVDVNVISVQRITRHLKYNPTTFEYDVAALLLKHQPAFSRHSIQVS